MRNSGTLTVTTPSDREIAIVRIFDSQHHLVFEALTRPELLKRWLYGPPDWSLEVCKIDLKVGDALRYVWRGPDGTEMELSGVHHEIVPPERIVHTELFDEDWTGGETLVTTVLDEHDGKITITMRSLFASAEERDRVVKEYRAIEGGNQTLDRLAEHLAGV